MTRSLTSAELDELESRLLLKATDLTNAGDHARSHGIMYCITELASIRRQSFIRRVRAKEASTSLRVVALFKS